MDPQTAISYLISPELQQKLFLVKIVFIAFTAFFFGSVVYYFFKTEWVKEVFLRDFVQFFFGQTFGLKKIVKYWNKVKKRLETDLESEWKLSIMEADDLLDDVLTKMGYTGESMPERLDQITLTMLPSIEEVRKVHQLRDNIVHDPDFRLTLEQARAAIEVYEKAFGELETF